MVHAWLWVDCQARRSLNSYNRPGIDDRRNILGRLKFRATGPGPVGPWAKMALPTSVKPHSPFASRATRRPLLWVLVVKARGPWCHNSANDRPRRRQKTSELPNSQFSNFRPNTSSNSELPNSKFALAPSASSTFIPSLSSQMVKPLPPSLRDQVLTNQMVKGPQAYHNKKENNYKE